MLRHYCYISKSKIDRLYEQTKRGNTEEYEVTRSVNVEAEAETDKNKISLLSLLGTDVSFGAEGTIQFNKKEKVQYAKKLQAVTKVLENANQIQYLEDMPDDQLEYLPVDMYYFVSSKFCLSDKSYMVNDGPYVDGIVIIESEAINEKGTKIRLSCSVKYFSDTRMDGKYLIHSENHYFFQGLPLEFDGLFVLTNYDKTNQIIYGSPLFLALKSSEGVRL